MWFINQFASGGAAYNIPLILRVTADDAARTVDPSVIKAAIVDVIGRHETLRTRFVQAVDGEVAAQITASDDVATQLEWTRQSATDEAHAQVVISGYAARGFDVSTDLPVRAACIEITPTEQIVVLVIHHIAADGESMVPLLFDLVEAYRARSAGTAPGGRPCRFNTSTTRSGKGSPRRSQRPRLARGSATLLDGATLRFARCNRTAHGPRVPGGEHAGRLSGVLHGRRSAEASRWVGRGTRHH